MLHSRYNAPCEFCTALLAHGEFCAGVLRVIEAKDEAQLWDLYLHKVYDKSFSDFKASLRANTPCARAAGMTDEEMAAAVKRSNKILAAFKPSARRAR